MDQLTESDYSSDEENIYDQNSDINILNPFINIKKILINDELKHNYEIKLNDYKKNFYKFYILCLNNNKLNKTILNKHINLDQLENIQNDFILIEGNFDLLFNKKHKMNLVVIDKIFVEKFNHNKLSLSSNILLLPIFNLNKENTILYLQQFTGLIKLEDYIKLKYINKFYKNINYYNLFGLLSSLKENKFWEIKYNCNLNLSQYFLNRNFNFDNIQKSKNQILINKIKNFPEKGDDYLSYLYKENINNNISEMIRKQGYSIYNIDNQNKISNDDINFIVDNINNQYELYKLTMNLLISKNNNHMILNNNNILLKLNDINFMKSFNSSNNTSFFTKYIYPFKYALSYSWITLYMEESIKKRNIKSNDRFVFSINNAALLPSFNINIANIKDNPYITLLMANNILDIQNNCLSLKFDGNGDYGVNTLDIFRKRLNIYMISNKDKNIFEHINWNNLAISGSVISACITKYNPLINKFKDNNYDLYFKSYYGNSDIDIMCNLNNNIDFFNKVYEVKSTIEQNINDELNIRYILNSTLIINDIYLKNNIELINLKLDSIHDINYIKKHLSNYEIKKYFYNIYIILKLKNNEKNYNKKYWKDNKLNKIYDISHFNNFKIVIKSNYNNKNFELIKFYENHKIRLYNFKILNHELEFFRINFDDFFGVVSQFHLPCVRGYYNGEDVKLLPSCITAAMTLINMDYKYFSGSNDPIEIINKYRARGYATILNDKEKIRLIEYSSLSKKWNKKYNNFLKYKKNEIYNILGNINITSNLYFSNLQNIKNIEIHLKSNKNYHLLSKEKYEKIEYFLKLYKNQFKVINKYGYINKINYWLFDSLYHL